MIEKRKHYKELVHFGEFKNKLTYYDFKTKKLYFSISERISKNQQYVILSLVLLVLPFIRFLNGLTIFSIPAHKYIYLILFSCLSLLFGKLLDVHFKKDLDLYPALFTDLEFLEFLEVLKKSGAVVSSVIRGSFISLLVSLVVFLLYPSFLPLFFHSMLLFILYLCLANNLHKRKRVMGSLIRNVRTN
ncbi:hypothetical protein B7711_05095 [Streptococcus oralis subsp. oralis]|uniref:Uncharacterized protein n=1 Tax=Streptococcus oralis subsp. oralis TaxID=1891914 RepID=A0ABD6RIY9_STROR|nr:hypothetical protein B7711_05095 [Streptococcus oralis subsp. oralis]